MPTLAIQDPDPDAKMAALVPLKCLATPCPASLVRAHWVIRLLCAKFPCLTLVILGRANMAELASSARWTITRAPARPDSAEPNAKPSIIAPDIRAKTEPNARRWPMAIVALAPRDSPMKPALWTLTSVNETLASTAVVSTLTDHTNVTATRVLRARIAKISTCLAVHLRAKMVVFAKPSILSTTNAAVRLVSLVSIAKKMSTIVRAICAKMELLVSMESIRTRANVRHLLPALIAIRTLMNVL